MDPGGLFFECRFSAYFLYRFWTHFGIILGSKMVPGGLLFEGRFSYVFWTVSGLILGAKVVILDHFGPRLEAF